MWILGVCMLEKLVQFFSNDLIKEFDLKINVEQECPDTLFNVRTWHVLNIIIGASFEDKNFCTQISLREIRNKTSNKITQKRLRIILLVLARFGLILVDSNSWISPNKRKPQTIYPNPMWKIIFLPGKHREKKQFAKWIIEAGNCRGVEEQGFKFTVQYGMPETQVNYISSMDFVESKRQEITKTDHENKQAENKKWRVHHNDWITVAAQIWSTGMAERGYGGGMPDWASETKTLTKSARSERQELIKTLESWGGGVTYLAWQIFNIFDPEMNDKGMPKYSTDSPWRQFVTNDKKPSQFTKHILSLTRSEEFKIKSSTEWSEIEQLALSNGHEHILKIKPRHEFDAVRNRLGYNLGERIKPTINV